MNVRLTLTTALAVILASVSVYPLIQGWGWFFAGAGAVLVVAAAGLLTRLAPQPATVAGCGLALIACLPLLAIPHWYSRAGAVAIVATAAAGLTRRRRFAGLAWLITYLAALLIYLNAAFAAGRSIAGFLPTRASIHTLASLASGGLSERASIPPVPGIHGIVLIAAAGVGLMAVATDLLAVRLHSPAIAGLPLLALYSVPITTNAKQGGFGATVVFCLGIIGYLAMLAADGRDRLRIWGRLVNVWQYRDTEATQGPDTRALAASGRRIGLAAISIAILLPLLIPGIGVHGLFTGHSRLGAGGKARVALPDPIAQMRQQLHSANPRTVLTYTSTAPNPADHYLQVYVLNYDGSSGLWRLVTPGASTAVSSKPLRPAPGTSARTPELVSRTKVKFAGDVHGYGSKLSFLPIPYAPANLAVDGEWAEDNATLMVYSTKTPLSGLTYAVTSKMVNPSAQQLESAGATTSSAASDYLSLPPSRADDVQLNKIAAQITNGKRATIDKARALQNWFTSDNRFRYSLTVRSPNSTAGLIDFLTNTKHRQGYCQQFAFAMAMLARALGIPSRIAVGYTAGVSQGTGTWRVTTADAHAWPELFFPGSGWLRFEPTPGGSVGQGTAVQPSYATTGPGGPGSTAPAGTAPGGPGANINRTANLGITSKLNRLASNQPGNTAASPTGAGFPYGWIILVVLAVALGTPATARALVRRNRWHRAVDDTRLADAAWRELRDDLADHGMACRASESPRAVAHRVTAELSLDEGPRQALERIASAEERARYAPAAQQSPSLREDVSTVHRAIAREADRPMRWRARVLPSSTLTPARSAVQNAMDVFGWMDAAGLRLRNSRLARRARLARPGSTRQILG
jgi:transglutaminase-like putative cysteine protease